MFVNHLYGVCYISIGWVDELNYCILSYLQVPVVGGGAGGGRI